MAWSAYLIQVTSGKIGPKVDIASGEWSVDLNSIETFKVSLKKNSLPPVNRSTWLTPWWGGLLLLWNDAPIFAGPIISRPDERFKTVSLDCAGIRSIFVRRFVVPEFSNWSQMSGAVTQWTGLGLGTIATRVAKFCQSGKSGGMLPVTYPQPDQTAANDADHQRTYEGWDLANISADAVFTKLSNVAGGPDIMFRPKVVDNFSRVVWEMWTGTEDHPRIPQTNTTVWDTTAVKGQVSDLQIVYTGSYQTNRVYSVGPGQDKGTLIGVAQDLTNLPAGFPLLETTQSVSLNTNNADPFMLTQQLIRNAQASLTTNTKALLEISLNVKANGPYPLGSYNVGDALQLFVQGWIDLADGAHTCRLLHMTGNLTDDVRLSLQLD